MFRILYNVTHANTFRMQAVWRWVQDWRWIQPVYGSMKLLGIWVKTRTLFIRAQIFPY